MHDTIIVNTHQYYCRRWTNCLERCCLERK